MDMGCCLVTVKMVPGLFRDCDAVTSGRTTPIACWWLIGETIGTRLTLATIGIQDLASFTSPP